MVFGSRNLPFWAQPFWGWSSQKHQSNKKSNKAVMGQSQSVVGKSLKLDDRIHRAKATGVISLQELNLSKVIDSVIV